MCYKLKETYAKSVMGRLCLDTNLNQLQKIFRGHWVTLNVDWILNKYIIIDNNK